MSKLESDDCRNAKLLLTEHHELYEQDHAVLPKPSVHPTSEELRMIQNVIVLPHVFTTIQRGLEDCEHSGKLLNRVIVSGAQVLLNLVTRDLHEFRRELGSRRIKLLDVEQDGLVTYHRYVCRGYEKRFGIFREALRSEISMLLTRYMGEITRLLRQMDSKETRESHRFALAAKDTN